MQKTIILITGALCLMLATPNYAQTADPTAPPDQKVLVQPAPAVDADQFGAHKQKLLDNISEHIAKMQKKQACIKDAADEKALNSCFAPESESGHQDSASKTAAPAPVKQ